MAGLLNGIRDVQIAYVLQRVLSYDTTSFCKYNENNRLLDTLIYYYHAYIPVQCF
jgi:hypothetical protein